MSNRKTIQRLSILIVDFDVFSAQSIMNALRFSNRFQITHASILDINPNDLYDFVFYALSRPHVQQDIDFLLKCLGHDDRCQILIYTAIDTWGDQLKHEVSSNDRVFVVPYSKIIQAQRILERFAQGSNATAIVHDKRDRVKT